MHQLFEEQVLKSPDSIAVMYEEESATFDELNKRANQLAHYMVRMGAGEDKIVAFCLERGIDMLAALLAISKTGASYLPIDPIYPRSRQESILNDAKPVFLLTQSSLFDKDLITDVKIILFDDRNIAEKEPENNLSLGKPENPLYVLYTSGSTGKPKGVPVRHNSTINVVKSLSRLIGVTDQDIIFTVTTIAFDIAELDIYMSLLSGGRLIIGSRETAMSMELLMTKLEESNATLFQATPVTFKMLIRAGWKGKQDLKIISGGEAMTKELGKQLLSRCLELWNCWGPTETTIYNSGKKVAFEDTLGNGLVSIGKPLDNNALYVVNQGLVPVPVGVGGEVYIAVTGLSPGYINLPEITKEKFIPNPFGKDPSDLLYKSGDLVKYLPDGNIAFISRVDTQVKIRGFRIELEEIESVMLRYNGIRETVIIAREDVAGEKKLVAYYTRKQDAEITHHDLRRFLGEKLPEYMIPASFVRLDALPLTANNKINRKALPAPDPSELESNADYIAPATDMEKHLAALWEDILEIPGISAEMNFFEAGGHSLTATQVLSKVNNEFHIELPFRIIFENFTIQELARKIEQSLAKPSDETVRLEIIPRKISRTDEYPLSSSQRRIWFLETLDETIRAYNIPLDFKFTGDLNINILDIAINTLISRHEAFRTVFPDIQGEPVQKVLPELKCNLEIINLQHESKEKMAGIISHHSLENARYKFHLASGPLFRFQILVLGESEFIFLINFHHIIFDAVSIKIFIDELKKVYSGLVENSSPDLAILPVTYSDYSYWQNEWLKGDECKRQLEFLKTELAGVNDILQLPLDFPRPKVQTYNGAEFHFTLDPGLKNKLIAISKKDNASLSISLLTAYAILLHRYSLQDDFVVGFPVANRMHPELETMIGVFINSLPIRFTFPTEVSFSEMTIMTMKKFLSAYENQEVPFEGLVEEMKVKRSLNINPIFQVLFNYLAVVPGEIELPGVTMRMLNGERSTAQFDLTLTVNDLNTGVDCVFEYNTDLFKEETIARMAGHYLNILLSAAENVNVGILDIPLLTRPEADLMLNGWNRTEFYYPAEKCIHSIFEQQVAKTPDSTAVTFEEESLSYSALNTRANQLANLLIENGAKEGTIIAVFLNRSIDLLTGLLAVSKTGATYLPLDPIFPKDRIGMILDDADPLFLLSQNSLIEKIPAGNRKLILMDDKSAFLNQSKDNLLFGNAQSPAYILYTSGSTGKPKGVPIKHHSVVNLVNSMSRMLEVSSNDNLLAVTTISFDIAELELYLPLFNGAHLVIASAETAMDAGLLRKSMQDHSITLFQATPVTFRMLILDGWEGKQDLKVLCGGEAFPRDLARDLVSRNAEVWNCYGPTETTIWSVLKKMEAKDLEGEGYVAIGRPIDNTRLYVLNSKLVPVPVGVPGELYIGGAGLSPGYLHLPELNAERFIPDPFSVEPGSKLYKTGDLVRYYECGTVQFLNRVDSQVKIRGFRIELGEIESVISQIPGIKENVVITRENDNREKMLVAYYVSDRNAKLVESELRQFMRLKLPDYMIPGAFISMEKLPLTANNKIDRKALPEPSSIPSLSAKEYVEPETLTEKTLAKIWSSILQIEKIGVTDDFFEIGGHSMIAVTMIIRIEKEFGIRLPLATLFDKSTVQQLARVIENGIEPDKWRSLVSLRPTGSRKPLFLIHGLGLNVLLYTTVINYLDPEQPVYGLQAKGLNGIDKPLETIEEIAAYYISEIMTVDTEGPYQLAGYSLGGIIAYEMAIQLTRMGKKVSFTGLLDAVADGSIDQFSLQKQIGTVARFLVNYVAWNIAYFFNTTSESRYSVIKRRLRGLEKKVMGIDTRISKEVRLSKGEERELPKYLRNVHQANLKAGKKYEIKPYTGRVHLFKADHQTFYILDPVYYGWSKFALGGVIVHEIPGEHSSTFAPPNDKKFAYILQKSLNETTISS
jgi:amino acid adenylation domain-containing protein